MLDLERTSIKPSLDAWTELVTDALSSKMSRMSALLTTRVTHDLDEGVGVSGEKSESGGESRKLASQKDGGAWAFIDIRGTICDASSIVGLRNLLVENL